MSDRVLVINAYGDVVEGAKAEVWAQRQKDVLRITAPGYIPRHVAPKKDRPVLLVIDPKTAKGPGLEKACSRNVMAAAATFHVTADPQVSLRSHLNGVVLAKQDRCYYELLGGEKVAKRLDRTGAFRPVSGKMHKPHEKGYELVGSWKTTRGAPDLQVTLWSDQREPGDRHGPPNYVAELDIDLKTGKGHIFEVARNVVTRGRTNPYLVNQALAWSWGIVPFRLQPEEAHD